MFPVLNGLARTRLSSVAGFLQDLLLRFGLLIPWQAE
jgi:hypothetical protein